MLALPEVFGHFQATGRAHGNACNAEEHQQPRYVFSVGQVAFTAAVSPNTNTGASGDEADSSTSSPSPSSASAGRPAPPRREAVTSDDVADGLLDEYEANAYDDVADGFLDEYEAICLRLRPDIPRSGRVQLLRKLASLPRGVTPLPVEAATTGVKSLVPSSDDADGKTSHVDNDDDDAGDDHVGDDDDDASHRGEQSSSQAPRDSDSQHGRSGSSNPSLTSPAPEPHDDSGASTEQADAHDPTPTGQFLSLPPPS